MTGLGGPGLAAVFVAAAIATWVAGIYLSRATDALDARLNLGDALGGMILLAIAGSGLAQLAGVDGVVFGATVLAAASALPEISTGIAAVRLGDHQLAVGDIFGGNAFQLCLLVVADLLAGRPILPDAGVANAWLGTLGIVMTVVYAASMIVRLRARHLGFGLDSIINTAIFVVGMIGLVQVAS